MHMKRVRVVSVSVCNSDLSRHCVYSDAVDIQRLAVVNDGGPTAGLQ